MNQQHGNGHDLMPPTTLSTTVIAYMYMPPGIIGLIH